MTMMRSVTASASGMTWVMRTTGTPRPFKHADELQHLVAALAPRDYWSASSMIMQPRIPIDRTRDRHRLSLAA